MSSTVEQHWLAGGEIEMNEYTASQRERNFGCRIREFDYRGNRCITLENAHLKILVCADKGADILEFIYKPLDLDFLWHSPQGLRDAGRFRQSNPLAQGNFREYFAGGWYEMLPNGPQPSSHAGADWGQHGEATLLPWRYRVLQDEVSAIEVLFEVDLVRIPLRVEKLLRLEKQSSTLMIREKICNQGGEQVQFLWGQHPTFGWPFLEEGCRIFLPSCIASTGASLPQGARILANQFVNWPHVKGSQGDLLDISVLPNPKIRSHDFVRLSGFEEGWFAITNPNLGAGFAFLWDPKLFPVLGYWQLFRGGPGYPWYQSHYLAALEPASDLPSISYSVRAGTAIKLEPSQELSTQWEATAFTSPLVVQRVSSSGVIE